MSELIGSLAGRHSVVVHYAIGHWMDVNNIIDLVQAQELQ
jgi:hypothetical protein